MWNRLAVISLGLIVVICLLSITLHVRDIRQRLSWIPVQSERQVQQEQQRFRDLWRSNP